MAHLYDIAGRFIGRVVAQKHQDIKGRLGQTQLLTQRLAELDVGQIRLVGKLDTRVSFAHRASPSFFFESFIFEVF